MTPGETEAAAASADERGRELAEALEYQAATRAVLGIIGGSLASALLGAVVLRLLGAAKPKRPERPSSDATTTDTATATKEEAEAEPASAAEAS